MEEDEEDVVVGQIILKADLHLAMRILPQNQAPINLKLSPNPNPRLSIPADQNSPFLLPHNLLLRLPRAQRPLNPLTISRNLLRGRLPSPKAPEESPMGMPHPSQRPSLTSRPVLLLLLTEEETLVAKVLSPSTNHPWLLLSL